MEKTEETLDIVLPSREDIDKAASDYAASQRTEFNDAAAVQHFKAGMRAFQMMMIDLTMEAGRDISIGVNRSRRPKGIRIT